MVLSHVMKETHNGWASIMILSFVLAIIFPGFAVVGGLIAAAFLLEGLVG